MGYLKLNNKHICSIFLVFVVLVSEDSGDKWRKAMTPYIRNLLHTYQPLSCLHSASQNLLCIPSCTTNFGRCFFSFPLLTFGTNLELPIASSTHWQPLIAD